MLLVGLAVGVDYCMFYLRREMEERDAGKGPEAALEAAAATSGRAVLISGVTVMVAMAGMFLAGSAVFTSFGVGTILVVAVAVLGSLTVLPAMLSWLGQKGWTEKGRVPYLSRLRHRNHGESRVWGAILDRVLKRPAISADAGDRSCCSRSPCRRSASTPSTRASPACRAACRSCRPTTASRTSSRAARCRPRSSSRPTDVNAPAVQAGIADLKQTRRRRRRASASRSPSPRTPTTRSRWSTSRSRATAPTRARRRRWPRCATTSCPQTIGRVSGTEVNVTGMTAGSKDFNDVMKARLPIVFAFVLGLAFVLLLVTFRSIVIPIKAIVLNLLSVGAAYGMLKLVFQDGHGESAARLPLDRRRSRRGCRCSCS